jgi:hypothetical protein
MTEMHDRLRNFERLTLVIAAWAFLVLVIAQQPASAAAITFADNFTPAPSPLWNNYSGNWRASAGTYFAQAPNNNPLTFSGLPFELTDFTVSVTIHSVGDGGLWLHSDGTNRNGVLLVTGGGGYGQGLRGGDAGSALYWHVLHNGTCGGLPSTSCQGFAIATGVFIPGGTYGLTVVVSDNAYSAFVNGSPTPATTFVDNTFSSGRVGLYDDQPNVATGSGFGPAQSFSDFSVKGSTVSQGPQISEPATTSLLCLAVLAFAGWRWRKIAELQLTRAATVSGGSTVLSRP